MEIVFLGTGGGRVNLIKQARFTGGFRINSQTANIHIDPGPGALLRSVEMRQDPLKLDAIIVTHNHTDHVNDARVLIEGMSQYALKRKGILIGSARTIEGDGDRDRGIEKWHQSKCATVYVAVFGEKKRFETGKGAFELEIVGLKHDDPGTFGFRLAMEGKTLGYISDTDYIENLGKSFAGCDLLIINCIKPKKDDYDGHLTTADVISILRDAKPKACVMTHMGMKMLQTGPAKEAGRVEKETGIKTVAARDGMKINV